MADHSDTLSAVSGAAARATGVLPSHVLRELVRSGEIGAERPVTEDQIQPASLDLRLGPVAYRVRASFLPGPEARVADKIAQFAMHEIDLSQGAVPRFANTVTVNVLLTLYVLGPQAPQRPGLWLRVTEFADAAPANATMQTALANAIKEFFFRLNSDCIPFPPSPAHPSPSSHRRGRAVKLHACERHGLGGSDGPTAPAPEAPGEARPPLRYAPPRPLAHGSSGSQPRSGSGSRKTRWVIFICPLSVSSPVI